MAAPHGERQRNLNAGFTEFTKLATFQDTQGSFEKSHDPGCGQDVASTSDSLHGSLDPSILSLIEDTSTTGEAKSRIDDESEATLLSALSEILDSVIEETLSPFDMLPDSDILRGQRGQDSKFKKLHSLAVPPSDRAAAVRATRSQRSLLSNSKAEGLLSDRQLRPRPRRRTQMTTVQRSDGEEEDLSETRRPLVRTFRIESDPALYHDEHQDGNVSVWLVDLVRHMHPYSLRMGLDQEKKRTEEFPEEDMFVDVVGDDDEVGENLLGVSGVSPLAHSEVGQDVESSVEKPEEETLKMCSSVSGEQNKNDDTKKPHKSVLAKMGNTGRIKKKVRFAPDISSIHEYQLDDEACACDLKYGLSSEACEGDVKIAGAGSAGSSEQIEASEMLPSQHGNTKPRSISLQEYRLLKRKTLPEEERKWDHRTKWPPVPEIPGDLLPIPCIPGYNPPLRHLKPSPANAKLSVPYSVTRPKRKTHLPLTSAPNQKALGPVSVHAVDPPNPVTLPLLSPEPVHAKTSSLSEKRNALQQQTGTNYPHGKHPICLSPQPQPAAQQASSSLERRSSLIQEPQSYVSCVGAIFAEVKEEECSPTVAGTRKANVSAPSSPMRATPVVASRRRPPLVKLPATAGGHQRGEEPSKESSNEMGIQAADVTSLLEQFETQGLTPPATPPHHIWNPLVPGQRAKPHKGMKPSSGKAIQIIEPRPLPRSKVHFKLRAPSFIPAPSLSLAFMDHDYCGTQEFIHGHKKARPGMHMHETPPNQPRKHLSHKPLDHRTLCEAEHLSDSVLLSPESSPCRLEGHSAGRLEEAGTVRPSRRSSPARGRTRRRLYRRRYHSDSSSGSSSCSSSCSSSGSSSSRSPPRKRPRPSRSSSSSSSRSSSRSLSPSPIRKPRHRSPPGSVSHSCSPQPDRNQKWIRQRRQREHYHLSRWEEDRKMRKKAAIEERRVVYVGRIRGTMTQAELRDRFALFGKIEDCTVHFRNHGDHYGFITYYNTGDAFTAIENGAKLRQPDELPFDICFGGRRQFCQSSYADLDSNRDIDRAPLKSRCGELDFDALLKQAQRKVKR
ncbi:peroxisome proliferator-activated receptor gamma coactivator-related protein 1 [Electrophorus electricus]|uniref:peroxisome proliferator-activated receptor gamma coactivator-related protein 1 n=1 Tax=Electrophorus electricus TaxID=8005 RepID=UPI0015CFE022|nr:peroxisome proliferator-activated receptor gamma coactivator-related protein 1 [Electrophorus electricus]